MARTERRRPKGRPRLPGGKGRKVKTNTVSSYSASHKLEVLDHLALKNDIELTISNFYPELPESERGTKSKYCAVIEVGAAKRKSFNGERRLSYQTKMKQI
ncbi:hypothetical protein PHMEG_00040270 [Phytophthora megakarya]|uniref:Uncharacterized protein n=1 Tax=Phytophthora megakarya TaxID=4795 RepID=A0A225UDC7_9STRA|nr:hypothetical protein PHMEG_00040270 [Phytophthora megakarya]